MTEEKRKLRNGRGRKYEWKKMSKRNIKREN